MSKYDKYTKKQLIELLEIDDEGTENLRNAYDAKVLENMRLKNCCKDTYETHQEIMAEIMEGLDNIIKYIEEHSNYNVTLVQNALIGKDVEVVINKLKELKK